MTINSKAQQDNTALFLSCAKEWANCEEKNTEEPLSLLAHPKKSSTKHKKNSIIPQTQESDSQNIHVIKNTINDKTQKTVKNAIKKTVKKTMENACTHTQNTHKKSTHISKNLSHSHFSHFCAHLKAQLAQSAPCSLVKSKSHAQTLLKAPHQAFDWHLCLMPRQEASRATDRKNPKNELVSILQENINQKNTRKREEVQDSLVHKKDLIAWLEEGMAKGWLRHLPLTNFSEILPNTYLPQENFWQRFSSICDHKHRVCLVLFQLPEMSTKTRLTENQEQSYLRELIEQILLTIKETDFFGEIKGFGVGLVLQDCGSFSATASAERILTRLEQVLQYSLEDNEQENISYEHSSLDSKARRIAMPLPIHVAVAEKAEGENADTLFAHAKEVMYEKAVIYAKESENRNVSPSTERKLQNQKEALNLESFHPKSTKKGKILQRNIKPLRVHVYRNTQKIQEKNSLVQSDEKRFLFFGMH